jgi:hypothetical protein
MVHDGSVEGLKTVRVIHERPDCLFQRQVGPVGNKLHAVRSRRRRVRLGDKVAKPRMQPVIELAQSELTPSTFEFQSGSSALMVRSMSSCMYSPVCDSDIVTALMWRSRILPRQ